MKRWIGNKTIDTPAFVASYRIKDFPRAGLRCHPWQMTRTEALLLNAFDLLANKRTSMFTAEIRASKGTLHKYVEFDGPLILDSGAFNFLQHDAIAITPAAVLDVGIEFMADVSVVLDHPFPPSIDEAERSVRLARTRENTRLMVEALARYNGDRPADFVLMPVLHGHDAATLQESLENISTTLGHEPTIVGVGSLAPLAKNGNTRKAIDVVLEARRLLPNAHIHCFSMGSALLMLLAFYCGADTVDSQSWIMSAAFKQVQLPGFYLTRLSSHQAEQHAVKYQRTRKDFVQRLLKLVNEEAFAVKEWDSGAAWSLANERDALAYLDYLEDRDGVNQIHRRACHNLYTFNFEAARVREVMQQGMLEAFIRSRMTTTRYLQAFSYAVERKAALHGS